MSNGPRIFELTGYILRRRLGQRPMRANRTFARANYLYFGLRDYAGALTELEIARGPAAIHFFGNTIILL